MDILVCIKQVPGSNKVEVDPVTGVLKRNGADSKMNPYDLYALECGLQLKEAYGGKLDVITMGPPPATAVIKEAYSMGADSGCIISDRAFGGADVLATSHTLAQGIKKFGKYDIIICGLQTTDGDTAQVGPEVSEQLGIPCVCNVIRIDRVEDNSIYVDMEMAQDIERVKIQFPCLITVQKDIVQPRLPSYLKKKETEKREVKMFTLKDMEDQNKNNYGLNGSATQVQRIFPPVHDKTQVTWEGTGEELAEKIFSELKVKKILG